MHLTVSELSKLFEVSVRTLHYYDSIGLLPPSETSDAGYRFYDDSAVSRLQQILFYRELDFSLDEISRILDSPEYDGNTALANQKKLLELKKQRLDGLIELIDRTLGGNTMSKPIITAADIAAQKKEFADEVRQRWGETTEYAASEKHSDEQRSQGAALLEAMYPQFAALRSQPPECEQTQQLVRQWQNIISEHFYPCSKQILSSLGLMYTADERFKNNIDSAGEGTADYLCAAIDFYCKN